MHKFLFIHIRTIDIREHCVTSAKRCLDVTRGRPGGGWYTHEAGHYELYEGLAAHALQTVHM